MTTIIQSLIVNSLLSGSFLIKFSSLSAPTKTEGLTAGSDEKKNTALCFSSDPAVSSSIFVRAEWEENLIIQSLFWYKPFWEIFHNRRIMPNFLTLGVAFLHLMSIFDCVHLKTRGKTNFTHLTAHIDIIWTGVGRYSVFVTCGAFWRPAIVVIRVTGLQTPIANFERKKNSII